MIDDSFSFEQPVPIKKPSTNKSTPDLLPEWTRKAHKTHRINRDFLIKRTLSNIQRTFTPQDEKMKESIQESNESNPRPVVQENNQTYKVQSTSPKKLSTPTYSKNTKLSSRNTCSEQLWKLFTEDAVQLVSGTSQKKENRYCKSAPKTNLSVEKKETKRKKKKCSKECIYLQRGEEYDLVKIPLGKNIKELEELANIVEIKRNAFAVPMNRTPRKNTSRIEKSSKMSSNKSKASRGVLHPIPMRVIHTTGNIATELSSQYKKTNNETIYPPAYHNQMMHLTEGSMIGGSHPTAVPVYYPTYLESTLAPTGYLQNRYGITDTRPQKHTNMNIMNSTLNTNLYPSFYPYHNTQYDQLGSIQNRWDNTVVSNCVGYEQIVPVQHNDPVNYYGSDYPFTPESETKNKS